ncbi:hypothetical protein Pmani_005336 [Petrolisthes manimaculis]|uniref:Uncharacterized protein n=1 Tax=Petrolisthes manimaculis TaxID=1843537 RepID=A0AAE1UGR7_9EUCA|nr:hypothetical protein Pmani_005336 [Petrolisthes manimaculis]
MVTVWGGVTLLPFPTFLPTWVFRPLPVMGRPLSWSPQSYMMQHNQVVRVSVREGQFGGGRDLSIDCVIALLVVQSNTA